MTENSERCDRQQISLLEFEFLKIKFNILSGMHTLLCSLSGKVYAKAEKTFKKMGIEEAADDREQ